MSIFYLSLFGALGVLTRHQIEIWLKNFSHFPFGVFTANIIGCLIAGIIYGIITTKTGTREIYNLILIGYCGGLTTFSSYCLKILTGIQSGELAKVILFTTLSIVFGVLAIWIGLIISKLT